MVRVKICGITSLDDAMMVVAAGADALGFVFYEKSPRFLTQEAATSIIRALPPFLQTVGLFVNAESDYVNAIADSCGIDIVQLHGDESPDFCRRVRRRIVKAFRVKDAASLDTMEDYQVAGYLLDAWSPHAHGGTGTTFQWELARNARQFGPVILAGGLNADNVARAVAEVNPFGVDVSSGVEVLPGQKDPLKVREFVCRAKGW